MLESFARSFRQGDHAFAYMQEIAEPLIRVLNYAAGLRRDLLAQYVANVEFWVEETKHRLQVIDTYPSRLRRMRTVHRVNVNYHWDEEHGHSMSPRPTKSIDDTERSALRREICESARRFLNRSFRESLIDREMLQSHFESLGLPAPGRD